MTTGTIHEIFSSLQGEGTHVGEPMTFVRFQGCALRCQWCDTPDALAHGAHACRVETPPRSHRFVAEPNPLTAERLTALCTPFPDPMIALTGGEPLEQAAFIAEWLAAWTPHPRIVLESGGILHDALALVLARIDIVSMDLKLPSSTGMRPYWEQHAAFLRCARAARKETYCKIVVTGHTSEAEVRTAMQLVREIDATIPVILQPVTVSAEFHDTVLSAQLRTHVALCKTYVTDVRMIPQMHKQWGLL